MKLDIRSAFDVAGVALFPIGTLLGYLLFLLVWRWDGDPAQDAA